MSVHETSRFLKPVSGAALARYAPARVWPIVLVLLSAVLFLVNTRHGIGVYVDSTRYMGLSVIPYDAPLYPWLLNLRVLFGLSIDGAAEVLGLLFVCANTALIWHLIFRGTRSVWLSSLGTALAVVSPQFVTLHALAMSEPPFLFLLLLTMLLFLLYLEERSLALLVACALALGLAALARFTAPALGAAVALFLLLDARLPLRRRISDIALFAGVSGAVFFGWAAFSQTTEGHSIGRELRFHGNMGPKEWHDSLEALTAWLLPDEVPFVLRVALLVVVAATVAVLAFREIHKLAAVSPQSGADTGADLAALLAFFIVGYLAFMVLATSVEANLALNGRYAFPAYVAAVMLTSIVAARIDIGSRRPAAVLVGLLAVAAAVLPSHMLRTAMRSADAYRSGVGYASVNWRQSPTVAAVAALPPNAQLFTNGQDAVAYLIGRPSQLIPNHFELRTGLPDPERPWDLQIDELRAALQQPDSYVVFFDQIDWRFYQAREDELVAALPLTLVSEQEDGRIYRMKPTASMPQT